MLSIYRYTFDEPISMGDAEATLHLAILATESLFGESQVRLDCGYAIDKDKRVIVLDGRNEVGACVNRIYAGFLTREHGGEAFRVRALPLQPSERAQIPA